MKDPYEGWDKIEVGQVWRNKSSKRLVVVLIAPPYKQKYVKLLHKQFDHQTFKQVHYFLYDYEQINLGTIAGETCTGLLSNYQSFVKRNKRAI